MENLLASILVYVLLVSFCLSNKQKSKTSTDASTDSTVITPATTGKYMDISCIFEEEVKKEEEKVEVKLESLSVKDLRREAKRYNIRQPYKMTKARLIDELSMCISDVEQLAS